MFCHSYLIILLEIKLVHLYIHVNIISYFKAFLPQCIQMHVGHSSLQKRNRWLYENDFHCQLESGCACSLPSKTMTSNVQEAWLPDGSLKVYVTEVAPRGNVDGGSVDWGITMPELSVAVAAGADTCALVAPAKAVIVMVDGQLTTGGTVSTEKWGVHCYRKN